MIRLDRRVVSVGWAVLLAAVISCGGGSSTPATTLTGTITFGAPLALSGPYSSLGFAIRDGMNLAVSEINSQKFLGSATLRLAFEDDASQASVGANAVRKLAQQENAVAMVGGTLSGVTASYTPIAQQEGVPFVNVSSNIPAITQAGPFIYSLTTPAQNWSYPTIDALAAGGVKTIAWLLQNDIQSAVDLTNALKAYSIGKKLVTVDTENALGTDTDFSSQLQKIKGKAPDALGIMGGVGIIGSVAVQARQLGIKAQLFAPNMDWATYAKNAGPAAINTIFTSDFDQDAKDPKTQALVAAYKAKYQVVPTEFAAHGYDAVWLLAETLKVAGKPDRQAVLKALSTQTGYHGASGNFKWAPDRTAAVSGICFKVTSQTSITYCS